LCWGEITMEGASVVCEAITVEGIRAPPTTRTFSFFIHLRPQDKQQQDG
jgi:hypothetical protein